MLPATTPGVTAKLRGNFEKPGFARNAARHDFDDVAKPAGLQ